MRNYIQSLPGIMASKPNSAGIARIINAALEAVNPQTAVKAAVRWDGRRLEIGGSAVDLDADARLIVLSVGKAGVGMARGLADVLGERISAGVVQTKVVPEQTGLERLPFIIHKGGHPLPDGSSLAGTDLILDAIQGLDERDLVICLISGGGSALLIRPIPGVSLAELQSLTKLLLRCGATIEEINTLRKHLDQVKGGRLVRLAAPARVVSLVLSDVVGNPLPVIASGPTVADPSTYADAIEILNRYRLFEQVPASILQALETGRDGKLSETLKPGDYLASRSSVFLVGSNQIATQAAVHQAQSEGYQTLLLTTYLQGEASQAGNFIAAIAREIETNAHPIGPPACVIAGGETTVTLHGGGIGGRNLELALGAVTGMAGLDRALVVTLATDGEDGSAAAAGAAVDGASLARGARLGLSVDDYLKRNDSYAYFQRLGDLLVTGSTGTNVNDLVFLFVE
jgi:glycerate 2-kinase